MSNNNTTIEDPVLATTEEMIAGVAQYFDADTSNLLVGSKANRAMGVDNSGGSGLNAALGQLSVSKTSIDHPEKRMKALHLAFEERMKRQKLPFVYLLNYVPVTRKGNTNSS